MPLPLAYFFSVQLKQHVARKSKERDNTMILMLSMAHLIGNVILKIDQ